MKQILLITGIISFLSCNSYQGSVIGSDVFPENNETIQVEELLGEWIVDIETRRGSKSSVMTIYQEDGDLKGKTERSNFTISQDGNRLSWNSTIESPMGSMNASHQVIVNGNSFSGTVSASGRSLDVIGRKRE